MSDDQPENPFEGIPFFGDLAKMFAQQGPLSWDTARQVALMTASGGESEANVDPGLRIGLEQLARVAELQVADRTGLVTSRSGAGLTVLPVTRAQWVERSLDAWRPLFELLAERLADDEDEPEPTGDDDPMAFLGPMMKMVGPMMLGMTAGGLLGELARRSFGQYDIPVPRAPSDELLIVAPNVIAFEQEWSLDHDDMLMWICLHEVAHHTVLNVAHVRARFDELLREYLRRFDTDHRALESKLGELERASGDDITSLQDILGDPEVLLGAIRSPQQAEMLPFLESLVSLVCGFVDWTMDQIGSTLIGEYDRITEAIRRRRVEAHSSDRFVAQLFGLELTTETYERGAAFIKAVDEQAGAEGLAQLWVQVENLPTPNELTAPGVWLARIGIESDLPGDELDIEIPDDLSGL